MRILLLAIALLLCASGSARALTTCPISEFILESPGAEATLNEQSLELIAAGVARSRQCDLAGFIILVDGQRRHGPGDAQIVKDATVARGITPDAIRIDLLTPESERWSEHLERGAIVVNFYFFHDDIPAPVEPPMQCFDVALIARITRYDAGSMEWPDDIIYIRWPWTLDLAVEQVLIGTESRDDIEALISLHAQYRPEVEYILFFLQGHDGDYVVVGAETSVVRNRRGEFVMPLAAPLGDHDVIPRGWAPPNYESYLQRISYQTANAWWLHEDYNSAVEGWSEQRGNYTLALRGLRLDELPRMLANSPRLRCQR